MSTVETNIESSIQTQEVRQFGTMAGDSGLPESYHLEGGGNFGVLASYEKFVAKGW